MNNAYFFPYLVLGLAYVGLEVFLWFRLLLLFLLLFVRRVRGHRLLELYNGPWLLSWSRGEMTERMLCPSVPSEETVCCLTVSLCLLMFPFFPRPLTIDPAGRAVPAWLQPDLDTLRNELDHTLVIDGQDTSALGELFEATPMVPTTTPFAGLAFSVRLISEYSRLVVSSCA